MDKIAIVDYGMGNIESVLNAFRRLGADCVVSEDPKNLHSANRIVLPGVGAFHAAMDNLRTRGFIDILNKEILENKKPFLGICLGMQLIANDSFELGHSMGLGWINGSVVRINSPSSLPVPHVGWNRLDFSPNAQLFRKIEEGSHYYFDHSYYLECEPEVVIATCHYGGIKLVAGIQKENIFAVQFHPEKSQKHGLRLLRNFLNSVKQKVKKC